MNKVLQVSFKYGWGAFYTDNNLNIDDTCFFSVIHKSTYNNDEEWEEKQEDDEAKLKVEVRKTNGGWRR